MLKKLDRLRKTFPDEHDIAYEYAKTLVNVTKHAGAAGDWTLIHSMMSRMDRLRTSFPDDRDIGLEETKAAFNVTYYAGPAWDWPLIESMLRRLDMLRMRFPDDQIIALREAQLAENVAKDSGVEGDWDRIDEMLARLDHLRTTFPNDSKIAACEARTAFIDILYASKAPDLHQRIYAMEQRCSKLEALYEHDVDVLTIIAAHRVGAYYIRRSNGWKPPLDNTLLTTRAAMIRISASAIENSDYMIDQCMQIISDAAQRFPESSEISATHRQLAAQGIDWSQVQPPPDWSDD